MDIQTNTFQDITDKKNSLLQNAEQIRQGWHEDAELFNDGQPLTMRELSMLSNIRQISKDLTADTQKFAQALLISKHRPDTDIADAWANLDLYTKEVIGKPAEYTKGRTQALMDMYKVTDLSIQRSKKALEWAKYDQAEDEEGKAKIAAELKAFDEQIASLQEHMPTDRLTTVLGWFAGNAPYMIDIAKEGGKGGAIATVGTGIAALALGLPFTAPLALGTAATLASTAFTAGSLVSGALDMKNIAKGAMYYELRQNGVEKDIAEWASEANGWLQAWIEMGLGATSAAKGLVMKGTGLDKVAYKTAVKLYASGKLGALARGLYNAAKTGAGEGAEEFFQGEAEWLTKLIVSELSDSGYTPDQTAAEALKQSVYEGLVGTAVGFGLGLPMDIVNTRMDMKYAQYLKDDAEFKSSKSSYIKKHMDDAIFSEMSEKQREDILGKIYDRNHKNTDKEKARQQKAEDIQKRKDALNAEKEDLQSQPESEFRDKRIDAIDTELADIERQEKESRAEGFRNNTENARQNYYEDPNAETKQNLEDVTEEQRQFEEQEGISEKQREYNEAIENRLDRDMTEEEVDNLVNLDQDVQAERARRVQTEEEQDWQKSPEEIEQVMSEPMNISDEERKNFVSLIKNKTQGQKISTREAEAILPMFNAIARGMGISVDDFISNHMMPEVARNVRVGETIDIDGQSVTLTPPNGGVAKGAVYFNPKDGRAIILLTEKADFSTWVHETGHIMRRYIQGDMLSSLENHYNVKDGVWTVAAEEQFTEDLTTYLMTRQAPTSQLKKVFQMIADALLNIYRDISKREKVSDDIARVFDQLFSDGRSAFSQEYNYDPDSMLYQITPEERAEADRQYAEVVAKYKDTDQWLKAPNGQPTKLTERQWVQVRTPNFKAWFGDWENDPQNASKVVDENGEPKPMYHGTPAQFDVFDRSKARSAGTWGKAFYFTDQESHAGQYGKQLAVFLNLRNPLTGKTNNITKEQFTKFVEAVSENEDYGLENYGYEATVDSVVNSVFDGRNDLAILNDINVSAIGNFQEALDLFNEVNGTDYDGVITPIETAVFEPTQIKSTTDNVGTFSNNNPSILFQRDAEYEEAVKSGDIEKAQAMLAEEAERKGYSADSDYQGSLAFNGSAPAKNGYYNTKEERKEAWDNGEYEGAEFSLGDFVDNKIDTHDLEWELDNPIPASARDPKTLASIRNLANVVKNKKRTIKMYRAVDSDIKENSFRNGDWITPSKEYAKNHITLQDWKKGRVIEQEVSIDDIWWNGDDINEWGYDDGKGYVYKNTPNNRKLFEITYDENGNLIPLSQRFNDSHSNLLFQSAYHGSGASFDKFDTDFMGTGEGAQAFGWGIYLTQSKGIAENYAEQMRNRAKGEIPTRYKGKDIKEVLPSNIVGKINDDMMKGLAVFYLRLAEANTYQDNIFPDARDTVQKQMDNHKEDVVYLRNSIAILEKQINDPRFNQDSVKKLLDDDKRRLPEAETQVELYEGVLKLLENPKDWKLLKRAKSSVKRNLYTVSIPDDTGSNYLYWDKNYKGKEKETIRERIEAQFDKEGLSWQPKYKAVRWNSEMNYKRGTDGRDIYELIKDVFKHEESLKGKFGWSMRDYAQQASEFLNRAGFVGIDYPANSMSGGNKYGKRNFVIFNADDITIDNHLLWQENEQTYEEATENGNYVPDDILEQYRGQEWADAEMQTRADLRSDAQDYETYEQFLPSMVRIDPTKTDQYYFEIWQTRQNDAFAYEDILPSLSKRMLEQVLRTIRKVVKNTGNKPEGLLGEYIEKTKLTNEEYNTMMSEIKSAPDKYISFITECFQNPEDFDLMMSALYRHPDYKIRLLDKEARLLKTDKKRASLTIAKLDAKIADIKQKLKDAREKFSNKLADKREKLAETRELYKEKLAEQKAYYQKMLADLRQAYKDKADFNRYVRIIMKKPPKMCAVEYAQKILAEQAKLRTSTMMDTTREILQKQYDTTTNPKLKARLKQDLEATSLREMTLEQVAEKAKEIQTLRREGVLKRMEQILANTERNEEQATKLLDSIGKVKPLDKTGSIESKEDKGHTYEKWLGFWCDIHRITEYLGQAWVDWFAPIRGDFESEERNVARRRDACLAKMKELNITADTLSEKEVIKGEQFATDPELGNTYSHDVLLSWYIYGQNDDSLAAILYGNFKGNPEDEDLMTRIGNTIDEGISRLTPEEKEFGDWMIDSFGGEDWDRTQATTINVDNTMPEKIPRYFMMIRQFDGTADAQSDPAIDLNERTSGARRASVRKGHTKERIHNIRWNHQKPIQLGALPVYMKAIRQQEHYIAFAQTAKDIRYVWGKVQEALASKYGAEFASDVKQILDRIIDPSVYNNFYNNMGRMGKLVSNTVVASLSWNALSWLKQFPSVAYFLPYCDGGSLINAWYQYATHPVQITKESFEKSSFLKNRKIDDAISMSQDRLMNPNQRFRQLYKIADKGMTPFGWFDEFACVIGWNAVYSFSKEHGATETEAIDKANVALLKTQPQAYAAFAPNAYTRTWLRTALLFSRQMNQINQMMIADLTNEVRSDKELWDKVKFFYRTAFCVALGSLLMGWAGRKFAGYGDDDDDKPWYRDPSWYGDIFKDIAANTVNNVQPFIGSALANWIQRKTYTSSGYSDPVSQFVTTMSRFIDKPVKDKELNWDGAMRAFNEVLRINGLPSVAAWRAYKAATEGDPWYLVIGSPLGGRDNAKKKATNKFKKK